MRRAAAACALWLGLSASPAALRAQSAPADSAPLLATGITGTLTSSGLESPLYALSFRPVQRLMLEAAQQPIDSTRAIALLRDTPVSLTDLLRLRLLRRAGSRYRLDYLLLTTQDQRRIYAVSERYGEDLARAILARRAEFAQLAAGYPDPGLRAPLMFDLVAGLLLNWEGLKLSTRLGYRVAPVQHANGDSYLVHSSQAGADLPLEGLYWGSESWPTARVTFTTFGDAVSFPRDRGLPNVFDGLAEEGLAPLRRTPALYGAVRQQLLTYLAISMDDLGAVMLALRAAPADTAGLRRQSQLPNERFAAAEQLLVAIGYVRLSGDTLRAAVPVLSTADTALVQGTLRVGRSILQDWLRRNVGPMHGELAQLTPMRNGLPFELVFSEVWHYTFGFATKALAESGFYTDPRAPAWRDRGYVPFVWATSLYSQ